VNLGFAGGNNYLLDKTRDYAWIALVNPDAFLQRNWLKRMLQAASNYPRYAFFASRLMMADRPGMLDGEGDVMNISGLAWRKNHGLAAIRSTGKPEEVFAPCAAAALYRRDALDESGAFDEAYFCYFEDVDLGFRLRLGGHRCLFVPDAVAVHVGSAATGGRHSDFAIYHGHRNLVWSYMKNMPGLLFWLLLPLHVLLNFVTVVWFCAQGKGRLILKAKYDALCGIPGMWKKRHRIQKRRKASIMEIWKALDKSVFPRIFDRLRRHL
jgi:GT2 family glycosyltransferase